MDTKSSLRRQLIENRKLLSEEKRIQEAEFIRRYLMGHSKLQEADVLMLYAAKLPEVDMDALLDWALMQGKRVCFPRVNGDDMDFYFVKDASSLSPGNFGVREPVENCEIAMPQRAVCLVPGVGFDRLGNRMGYGKGYYDKYFHKSKADIVKIGVCYDEQLLDALPAEKHDIKMDMVISASEVIDVVNEKGHCSIWI